jgi:hypothetical protein
LLILGSNGFVFSFSSSCRPMEFYALINVLDVGLVSRDNL